jgi:IS30 family transposase
MSHLNQEQRYMIATLKSKGKTQQEIAELIGKDKSVVSRELSRNCDKRNNEYKCDLAQRKYQNRLKEKRKSHKFTIEMKQEIDKQLAKKFSPEQIVGNAKRQGQLMVSHERIYQHIWEDKRVGGSLYEHLRSQGKKYRKRGSSKDKRGMIKNRIDIEMRPTIVEEKVRVGDLEIDTMIGKNHQGAIVTINDRVSGMLKMKLLASKDSNELANQTIEILEEWQPYLKTMTSDNGKEFAEHEKISRALNVSYYFAKPYHSWERGANENLNELIRQYIPKKTDFSTLTDEYVKWVEDELNNRPRKRHEFQTPIEVFNTFTKNQPVAFNT